MWVAGLADDEPDIDVSKAMSSDPIVGTEAILHDGNGTGARRAQPIKAPAEMTPAQWEEHMLTHLPCCAGCPFCCIARKPDVQHRQACEWERNVPMPGGSVWPSPRHR